MLTKKVQTASTNIIVLSDHVTKHLNQRINREAYSSSLYSQMASWCEANGWEGCAQLLHFQAQDELSHMQKLMTFVNESGGMALIGAVEAPPAQFDSLIDLFRHAYEHEREVSRQFDELVQASLDDRQFAAFNFLQWFVAEQHEEEVLFKSILDKVHVIGDGPQQMYFLDKEVAALADRKQSSVAAA